MLHKLVLIFFWATVSASRLHTFTITPEQTTNAKLAQSMNGTVASTPAGVSNTIEPNTGGAAIPDAREKKESVGQNVDSVTPVSKRSHGMPEPINDADQRSSHLEPHPMPNVQNDVGK